MNLVASEDHECRYKQLEKELQALMGPHVAVVCTGIDGDIDYLWPEERNMISSAVPRRQREFAAGRVAAREAIRRLTGTEAPIPTSADRSPCWPAGIVGSITHDFDTCVAIVGDHNSWLSIGIDIESNTGIDESLWDLICTPEELHFVRCQKPSEQPVFAKRLFVAKEAFYKWHYPLRKTILDFQEVSVQWIHDGYSFKVGVSDHHIKNKIDIPEGRLIVLESQLFAYCIGPAQWSFAP